MHGAVALQANLQRAKDEVHRCRAEQNMVVCKLVSQTRILGILEGQKSAVHASITGLTAAYDELSAKREILPLLLY